MCLGKDTIKFDYEYISAVYDKILINYDEANQVIDELKAKSIEAVEEMRGQYREGYKEKSEEAFKAFKKNIKNMKEISDYINSSSIDFNNIDITISKSIESKN